MKNEETISDVIQRTATNDYAARNNIIWITIDDPEWPSLKNGEIWEQHTGRVWHKRKGVLKIMELIESGAVQVVVLWKWNRLSRKRLHWVVAEEKIHRLGGSIESATEPVDLSTATGRFTRAMLVDLSELQSDLIGESWLDTKAVRRARGLPSTGGARFGYTWIRGAEERYDIRGDLVEPIRWMYATYIDGAGRDALASGLNSRGITNARGNPWTNINVIQHLDSGFAAGLLVRTSMRDDKVYVPPFPERIWEPGAHKPIIDADTWERYKAARLERRHVPPRQINPAHPLAGLIVCGDDACGNGAMKRRVAEHERSGGTQFVCARWARTPKVYRCVTVAEGRVHRAIHAWLQQLVDDVDLASAAVDLSETKRLRSKTDIKVAEGDIADIERQLVQLTRKHLVGLIPESTYVATRDELVAERANAETRLRAARLESEPKRPPVEIAVSLLRDWEILPVIRRRSMLSKLIKRITIYPSEKRYGRAQIVITPQWEH